MARFMIKASEYKNVCKSVNNSKLAELKKEIIEILKKQDEKEVKKAVDYFNSQELHYTHLEKSFTGKWVEKAGYGIGTIRIWKGKKYKKIAPGKWARVFEKEGRGTNIAIGKLIAKVQKIDNVEDLMNFVMANKQRFVDENGVDLPVLNKLRAAVDAKNNGDMGSKGTSKPAENKYKGLSESELKKEVISEYDKLSMIPNKKQQDIYETIEEIKNRNGKLYEAINEKFGEQTDKVFIEAAVERLTRKEKKNKKPAEKIGAGKVLDYKNNPSFDKYKNMSDSDLDTAIKNLTSRVDDMEKQLEDNKDNENVSLGIASVKAQKNLLATLKQIKEDKKNDKPAEKKTKTKEVPFGGVDKNDEGEGVEALSMADKINEVAEKGQLKVGNTTYKVDKDGKEWAVRTEIMNAIKCKEGIDRINDEFEKKAKPKLEAELKEKLDKIKEKLPEIVKEGKLEENKKLVEERLKRYSEGASEGLTIDDVISNHKKDVINKLENHVKDNELFTQKNTDEIELLGNVDHQVELCSINTSAVFYAECKKLLDEYSEEESEAEKTQNRSDAMKGNKNAYKGGNKEDLQNELMSLSKQKSEILDEIKKTNGDLAKINQDKYNDEARGNPTEDYNKQIEELKKKMDNLQDEHATIEKRGNDIVKELDKLEKEEKKVIENNPKSIEGMEFVNKNKMHVLANFLANHDNVNMATAVIRLQAAYERLGEENFLAHFPKDVVERYRKEAGKEEPKKKSFTPISKDKMKSMSDDELKDYEAKLEKDLLATSRTDPDYVEKYNHWREVHGENNDRFHQAIEDEARAEKQAEADAKSAKEKEINEKYNGYFENRKGLDRARDLKSLEKKYNFDGKVMSTKEFVEDAIKNGAEIKEREVNKVDYPSRTRWNRMTGYEQDQWEKKIKEAGKKTIYTINGFEFPKNVVDYAKFYKEKGKSSSGSDKPSKSEIAIKNKASSLAGAFGYSKDYAMKMGAPFNLELAEQTVDEELDWDEGSKKALKEELKNLYAEKKVRKSLFDGFLGLGLIEEDIEDMEEDEEERSLWNDYSAEQPELFNSTELKVREALNRRYCNCL